MKKYLLANFITLFAFAFLGISAAPALAQTARSGNWSGYIASGGNYTSIEGTWTIPAPTITGSATAADAAWVGIGGSMSKDLIQAGTQALVRNGNITYRAWYEILPEYQRTIPLVVRGGDSVTVSLNETSADNWHLLFRNDTTNEEYETTIAYRSSRSSAEWIEEAPLGSVGGRVATTLPLDNFGAVQFSDAYTTTDGNRENLATSGASPVTMVSGREEALATPSGIGSDGASFSVERSSIAPTFQYRQSDQTLQQRSEPGIRVIRVLMPNRMLFRLFRR